MKRKRSKGFTLIELMVVISIISLLSSIVLASVKEVREKAKVKAFRSEVNQFINALELYRNDNASYPGVENGGAYFEVLNFSNTINYNGYYVNEIDFNLRPIIAKYIKKIPNPTNNGSVLMYTTLYNEDICGSDSENSPYSIIIYQQDMYGQQKGFEDWYLYSDNGYTYRCFYLR